MGLETDFGKRTINELALLHRMKQINLEPGFQRKSVWALSNRRKLIQSIIAQYPIPSIFLYRRNVRGKPVYDVIDGKQRLETIFMFMEARGFKGEGFQSRLDLQGDLDWWEWREIKKYESDVSHRFLSYSIQTVEVSGDFGEIVDLFVRINSTGKPLTASEKRHAQYYDSPFLKSAERLARKNEKYLTQNKIVSKVQINRMKAVELFSELLMSIHKEGPINKKTSLDKAIGNESINTLTLRRLEREFLATLRLLKTMFPEIRQTRFKNSVEFYSLFMLVWEMNREKLILKNKRHNKIAFEILRRLSTGVDELRENFRRAKTVKPKAPYSDYLMTVQGDTDSQSARVRRAKVLSSLLKPLFEKKDAKRLFTSEQRRILWNSDATRLCSECGKKLRWSDFTVDHVKAWTRGGKTRLSNAQLLCRECNSSKGAGRAGKKTKKQVARRGRKVARKSTKKSAKKPTRKPARKPAKSR